MNAHQTAIVQNWQGENTALPIEYMDRILCADGTLAHGISESVHVPKAETDRFLWHMQHGYMAVADESGAVTEYVKTEASGKEVYAAEGAVEVAEPIEVAEIAEPVEVEPPEPVVEPEPEFEIAAYDENEAAIADVPVEEAPLVIATEEPPVV